MIGTTFEKLRSTLTNNAFSLKKCPNRPIIFIAHSFGGLVLLKVRPVASIRPLYEADDRPQILVQASRDFETSESISDKTMGLILFGTPLRGADASLSHGEILQLAQEQIAAESNLDNLRIMQDGDESLESLVDDYLSMVKNEVRPYTVCFYESRDSDVGAIVKNKVSTSNERSERMDSCNGTHCLTTHARGSPNACS